MRVLNSSSVRGAAFVDAYKNSRVSSLAAAYKSGRYSSEKETAQNDCISKMRSEGGENFRILSAGRFFFSCGWMTAAGLRVETVSNSYLVV